MMKKLILAMSVVFLLTGCVQETIVITDPLITDADLYYEYYSDNWGTTVEGELFNDGETFIDAVQIELRFYDRRGLIIDYEYAWIDTYFAPGESVGFFLDYPYRGVSQVEVFITRYD